MPGVGVEQELRPGNEGGEPMVVGDRLKSSFYKPGVIQCSIIENPRGEPLAYLGKSHLSG